jgi:hypothetical protein
MGHPFLPSSVAYDLVVRIIISEVGVYALTPTVSRPTESEVTGYTKFGFIVKIRIEATKKMILENRQSTGIPLKLTHKSWRRFVKSGGVTVSNSLNLKGGDFITGFQ